MTDTTPLALLAAVALIAWATYGLVLVVSLSREKRRG